MNRREFLGVVVAAPICPLSANAELPAGGETDCDYADCGGNYFDRYTRQLSARSCELVAFLDGEAVMASAASVVEGWVKVLVGITETRESLTERRYGRVQILSMARPGVRELFNAAMDRHYASIGWTKVGAAWCKGK